MIQVIDSIATLKAYEPGKPISELEREFGITDVIKLASNENPLGPGPKAIKAIEKVAKEVHYYPVGAAYDLRQTIADFHEVSMDEVETGNGSNEFYSCENACLGYGDLRKFLASGRNRSSFKRVRFRSVFANQHRKPRGK